MYNYCVIIGAYNPPEIFFETVKKLEQMKINTFVIYSGKDIDLGYESKYIRIIKANNYGIGSNFNMGMKLAIDSGFDLMTLFTDDVSILPDFSEYNIIDYYSRFCSKDDILSLIFVNDSLRTTKFILDSGMTFSSNVAKTIQFRTDLIIDQQDVYFCYQLNNNIGGKIKSFNKIMLNVLPVGRSLRGNMNFIPSFRIYLITRNSLKLFLETKNYSFFKSFIYFAVGYLMKAIIGKEKNSFYAFFAGIVDSLRGEMGVTVNLQKLSDHRFSEPSHDH